MCKPTGKCIPHRLKYIATIRGIGCLLIFRKSDLDHIYHKCGYRKMCALTLQKRGKEYFLNFPFEEDVTLADTNDLIVGVDLGLNSACTCCIMDSKGAIYGRRFPRFPSETDRLNHAVNRIKKARQYGNRKTPRL